MHAELVKYAAAAVPRYTSYPTAVQFRNGVSDSDFAEWLELPSNHPTLSIYLHIPFCPQRCWYCGCHTSITRNSDRIRDYLALLHTEIDRRAAQIGRQADVVHIHLGGGTPSYLEADDLNSLLDHLRRRFDIRDTAEIAMEIDPRTLTPEKARELAKAGINRVSLGVQDFDERVQKHINRVQSYELVAAGIDWLRDAGIRRISMDLIYGLPGQSQPSVEHTARRAAGLAPDRLSVFGYAHLPSSKKHQRLIDGTILPRVRLRYAQAQTFNAVLTGAGYERIGLDHYAKPRDTLAVARRAGCLRRNFQGYTDDPADALLGLGASAISNLPGGYAQNQSVLYGYGKAIKSSGCATARGCSVTAEDRMRRGVIEKIMCGYAIDTAAHAAEHGFPADALDDAIAAGQTLAADGLVRISGRTLRPTDDGLPFLRNIAACFDSYLQPQNQRHSRAV